MNIYDFDGTIYNGDSTADFIVYCAKKYPHTIFHHIITAWSFLMYILGVYSKTKFKEKMYGFLKYVPESAVNDFWETHKNKIKPWYYEQQREDDTVISASPEFLIKPICNMIGIENVMASVVDFHTGRYNGENCHDSEKVRRLYEWNPSAKINEFYSDSFADTPLAELSKQAFMVKGNKRFKWNEYELSAAEKFKKMFLSREFLMFLIIGGINTINGVLFASLYSVIIPNANIAFIAGYISSMVISYILNSFLTFHERLSFIKYVKFFISYMPNFIIQNIMVIIFYNMLHWQKILVYALAAVIGVPVTFLFMKVFAFKKKSH